MSRLPILALIGAALGAFAPAFAKADYEEPAYAVVKRDDVYEIRRYARMLVVETTVEGPRDEAANQGFRRLFAYIQGANEPRQAIEMTRPVQQEGKGEQIPMTAPVTQIADPKSRAAWTIAFVLPARFRLETAPKPSDPRVTLREIGPKLAAAVRFSGRWRDETLVDKTRLLQSFIARENLVAAGEPAYAFYNPPFTPPFFRRNEVVIPLKE